jgi:transposase
MLGFEQVFAALPEDHVLENGVMDKGYDSDAIRAKLKAQQINPVIPPKKNRKELIEYDKALYKLREKVERFFNRLKQFRRIATRYDKLGTTYLAFIHVVAAFLVVK